MQAPLRILHLEDDPKDAELIHATLEAEGIVSDLTRVETETDFLASLERGGFDLIFADYTLPSFDGLSALKIALQKCPGVPFIFISGTLGEEVAIEALKIGATDYILKQRLSRIVPSVHRAIRESKERAERKRAEDALRRGQAYLAEAQRLSYTGSFGWDVAGGEIYWSQETFRIFGYDPATKLTTELVLQRTHPEDRRLVRNIIDCVSEERKDFDFEHRLLMPDGSVKHLQVVARALADKAGRLEVVGAVMDITERKQDEQRLMTQHTVTQLLAGAATLEKVTPEILQTVCEFLQWDVGALWRIDREAGVLRCVEIWHKESVTIPEFEAISRERTFMRGIGLPGRVWSSQEPAYIPDVVHDVNFSRAPIAAREGLHAAFAFPILLGGEVLGVMEFFSHEIRQPEQDLLAMMATVGSQIGQFIERKRAEDALRHAQMELTHVTRVATLGEMTASIAHEINQPLSAIANSASACLRWLDAQKLEEARRSASRVIAESHRASEIIGRIRELAKKAPPRKDWLDVNETIHEVIALVQNGVQRNRIAVEAQLSDDVPLISADRVQLQQVILNLMMNAIEAIGGGEGPRELLIRSGVDGSQGVLVSVQDSGPGLDPNNLDHLFDAFYTTKPQGLGMGLAISRSLVEAHGGRLWASANAPHGAVFQFTLPIGTESEA
jgi:PAS domain S-box-containing protein